MRVGGIPEMLKRRDLETKCLFWLARTPLDLETGGRDLHKNLKLIGDKFIVAIGDEILVTADRFGVCRV